MSAGLAPCWVFSLFKCFTYRLKLRNCYTLITKEGLNQNKKTAILSRTSIGFFYQHRSPINIEDNVQDLSRLIILFYIYKLIN